jgi:TatD DNase family protein
MLIDTHCHLTDAGLRPRLDEVLDRASAAGIDRMIVVATSPEDWLAARRVVEAHEPLYLAAGLHPHKADLAGQATWAQLAEVLRGPKAVAIGETGLEYHYDFSSRDNQHAAFGEQLRLARQLDKPVIIHCREAQQDCLAILDEQQMRDRRVVFHCFSGGPDEAHQVLDRGWYVSFAGVVTFKNARDLQAAARIVPADRLLIETDSPYLTPEPIRKVRPNEPAHMVHTAHFLADLRGVTFEDLVATCTASAQRFFGLAG